MRRIFLLAMLMIFGFCISAVADPGPAPTGGPPNKAVGELMAKCDTLTRMGEYDKALEIAEKILAMEDSYGLRLRMGWIYLMKKQPAEAIANYELAAKACPTCIDPHLGMQGASIEAEKWDIALEQGRAALAMDSQNYLATIRQALAYYMLGKYSAAESYYSQALTLNPDSGDALLGMGFSKIKRGEPTQGRGYCERAGAKLPGDPRVEECLKEAEGAHKLRSHSLLSATYLTYTDPWNIQNVNSGLAYSSLTMPNDLTVWAGLLGSYSMREYVKADFSQFTPGLGIRYAPGGWFVKASGAAVVSNDDEIGTTPAFVLGGGFRGNYLGLEAQAAVSAYPDQPVYQLDMTMPIYAHRTTKLFLGPRLISFQEEETVIIGRMNREEETTTSRTRLSVVGGIEYAPIPALAFAFSGFGGEQQYALELDGLSLWTADDLFAAGYDAEVRVYPTSHFGIYAIFHHQIGTQQENLDHDFSVLGGSLGFELIF